MDPLLNPLFMFRGFGPALRSFDKAAFYRWSYRGLDDVVDDFFATYCAGWEL